MGRRSGFRPDRGVVDARIQHAGRRNVRSPRPKRQPIEAEQPGPVMDILTKQLLAAKADRCARRERDIGDLRKLNRNLNRRVARANDHHALTVKWRRFLIGCRVEKATSRHPAQVAGACSGRWNAPVAAMMLQA